MTPRPRPRQSQQNTRQQEPEETMQAGQEDETFQDVILHTVEAMNERIQDLEAFIMGGGNRFNRGINSGRWTGDQGYYRPSQQQQFYDSDYRYQNRGQQGGFMRDLPRNAEERLARLENIIQNRNTEISYGPRSGFGPRGERAFSGLREGNENRMGIPLTREGSIDQRTMTGRILTDDQEWSDDDLESFMADPNLRTADGTFDLRTVQGRALLAAGWVDENGRELSYDEIEALTAATEETETTRGNRSASNKSRSRNQK